MLKTFLAKAGFGQRQAASGPAHVDYSDHLTFLVEHCSPRHTRNDLTREHLVWLVRHFEAGREEWLIHQSRPSEPVAYCEVLGVRIKATARVFDASSWHTHTPEYCEIMSACLNKFNGLSGYLASLTLDYMEGRYISIVTDPYGRASAIITDHLDDGGWLNWSLRLRGAGEQ